MRAARRRAKTGARGVMLGGWRLRRGRKSTNINLTPFGCHTVEKARVPVGSVNEEALLELAHAANDDVRPSGNAEADAANQKRQSDAQARMEQIFAKGPKDDNKWLEKRKFITALYAQRTGRGVWFEPETSELENKVTGNRERWVEPQIDPASAVAESGKLLSAPWSERLPRMAVTVPLRVGGMLIGGAAAAPSGLGAIPGAMVGAAAGDSIAQEYEKSQGMRQNTSLSETGLNALFAGIPIARGVEYAAGVRELAKEGAKKGAQTVVSPLLREAAAREAAQAVERPALLAGIKAGAMIADGGVSGVGFEGLRQLSEGEKLDWGQMGWAGGIGSLLGGALHFGPIPVARVWARLRGKSPVEAARELSALADEASKAGKPEEAVALTGMQREIEERLGVAARREAGSAEQSARAFEGAQVEAPARSGDAAAVEATGRVDLAGSGDSPAAPVATAARARVLRMEDGSFTVTRENGENIATGVRSAEEANGIKADFDAGAGEPSIASPVEEKTAGATESGAPEIAKQWEDFSKQDFDEMSRRVDEWLSPDNIGRAKGKTRDEIFSEFGNKPEPIAVIPDEYLKYFKGKPSDGRVYSGKGYFIDHAVNSHPEIDAGEYGNIQKILDFPDEVLVDNRGGSDNLLFVKNTGKNHIVVTQLSKEADGRIIFHKSFHRTGKKPYPNLRRIGGLSEGGVSSISRASEEAPGGSLSARDVGDGSVVSTDVNAGISQRNFGAEKKSLLEQVDEALKRGDVVDVEGVPARETVKFSEGGSSYNIPLTKEALLNFRKGLLSRPRGATAASVARASGTGRRGISEVELRDALFSGDEATVRSALDMASEKQIAEFNKNTAADIDSMAAGAIDDLQRNPPATRGGLARAKRDIQEGAEVLKRMKERTPGGFVKYASGVTLPSATAESLEIARAGKGVLSGSHEGFVAPRVIAPVAGGGVGGAAGFAYGYNSAPEGASEEERILRGLKFAGAGLVVGAGGGYVLGRAFLNPSLAANVARGAKLSNDEARVLNSWEKRLSGADAKPEVGGGVGGRLNRFRQLLGNRFAALDMVVNAAERAGGMGMAGDTRLSQVFQNVRGANGKGQAAVMDFLDNVVKKVPAEDRRAFDVLLGLKRAGQRLRQDVLDGAKRDYIERIPEVARTPEERAFLETHPADRRRVAQDSLADVDAGLSGLRKMLGDEKFARYDELAAGAFQQEADRALRVLVDGGVLSEAQYAGIKAGNDFYAPFKVIHEAELASYGAGGSNKVPVPESTIKAMSGIDNPDFRLESPTAVMAEKIYGARLVAERNRVMRRFAVVARQGGTEDWARVLKPHEEAPAGMEAAPFFEDGVRQRIAVNKRVAESLNGLNDAQLNVAVNLLRGFNRVFRSGATGLKVPFSIVNFGRDQIRSSMMSRYGLLRGGERNAIAQSAALPLDMAHGLYVSLFGRQAAARGAGAVAGGFAGFYSGDSWDERLGNAALGAAAGYAGGAALARGAAALGSATRGTMLGRVLDAESIYRDFLRSGAAGSIVMTGLEDAAARGTGSKLLAPARGVLSGFEEFAKALEEATKIMSWKRGLRQEGLTAGEIGKLNPAQIQERMDRLVSDVRNFGGSPDFDKAGTEMRKFNMVVPFLNARLQGYGQDVARLAGRDGAKQAALSWAAGLSTVGTAAAYFWFLNHRPENAADYDAVPDYEKNGFVMIPRNGEDGRALYFTNEQGQRKREYYRVPISEHFGNIVRGVNAALDFARTRDAHVLRNAGDQMINEASPINISGNGISERWESFWGSLGPLPSAGYTLATGREAGLHRSLYRNQNEERAREGVSRPTTPEVYNRVAQWMPQWVDGALRSPVMLESVTNQLSGGFFQQFIPKKKIAGRDERTNEMAANPFTSRFVGGQRVAGDEKVMGIAREEAHAAAAMSVEKSRELDGIIDDLRTLPVDKAQALLDRINQNPEVAKLVKRRIVSRQYSEESRAISQIGDNEGKARAIARAVAGMNDEKGQQFLDSLEADGVMSKNVLGRVYELEAQRVRQANPQRN